MEEKLKPYNHLIVLYKEVIAELYSKIKQEELNQNDRLVIESMKFKILKFKVEIDLVTTILLYCRKKSSRQLKKEMDDYFIGFTARLG